MARTQGSDLDFQSAVRILNLPPSTQNGHPVVHEQLTAAIEGIAWKDNVRVSSQGNVNINSPGASLDGITMAANDRVLLRNQTDSKENGIWIWNGAAVAMTRALDASTFDELESATVRVDEGTDAGTKWRQTQVNGVIGTNNVLWVDDGASAPAASTTTAGLIEIATQAEVDTGTDTIRAVTPSTLANWSGRIKKAVANIGDNSATQFDVTHNFGTRDVDVEVYRNSTPWDAVGCDVERPDTNTVRLRFAVAPTSNQFRVVILA